MLKLQLFWEHLSILETNWSYNGPAGDRALTFSLSQLGNGNWNSPFPTKVGSSKGYSLSKRLKQKQSAHWLQEVENEIYLHERLNSHYFCWLETPSRRIDFKMVWGCSIPGPPGRSKCISFYRVVLITLTEKPSWTWAHNSKL